MKDTPFSVVTGAFSYTGKYITRLLLKNNQRVVTLTGHPRNLPEFGERVKPVAYSFDDPAKLVAAMRGAQILYNTYWVRFDHQDTHFEQAVANTRRLFEAALQAGVERIVHVSIANPSLDSPLPYYRGKAELERSLAQIHNSYAILRPTVIFGKEDILINNIAYLLRRFPLFAVPGDGHYRLQPIYVEDMAELAVALGARRDRVTLDAVGPETYTFNQLLALIAAKCLQGRKVRLVHVAPRLALWLSQLIGAAVQDVILTADELHGLMENLLISSQNPSGHTRLSNWLAENASWVGSRYASELDRHFRSQS